MKREIYSLKNEEFAFLVRRIGEVLRELQVPHTVVGGTAVQAYTLERMCRQSGLTVSQLERDRNVRLQDHLRATDDIDLALKFPDGMDDSKKANVIFTFLEMVKGDYVTPGDDAHLVEYEFERKGIQRPRLTMKIDDAEGESIALNISRREADLYRLEGKFYTEFIERGRDLVVPYAPGFDVSLKVYQQEHVLATKIAQMRPKDLMDIQSLIAVVRASKGEVDFAELERVLLPVHQVNYERFRGLVGIPCDSI